MNRQALRPWILFGTLIGLLYMTRDLTVKPAATVLTKYLGTRGLRNNNPGNIRDDNGYLDSSDWVGQIGVDGDGFAIFDTPVNGIRAIVRVLRSYDKRGLNTIGKIISTWAPPSENNTQAYINAVVKKVGKNSSEKIYTSDYPKLVSAIIAHENFVNPYPDDILNAGIAAGLA
jgi:hypothetical protein